jgi:hypothetical protein
MTFDTTGKISIAQLAFFAAALGPANYVLWKHGVQGIMGWLFISLFCVIRIVGAAIIIHDESGGNPVSEAGLIISSVAIAPLIIATSGIAHESYASHPLPLRETGTNNPPRYQSLQKYSKFLYGYHPHISVHVGAAAAIALLIVGFIKIDSDTETLSEKKTGLDLIRVGAVILLAVWALIAALFMSSFRHPRAVRAENQVSCAAFLNYSPKSISPQMLINLPALCRCRSRAPRASSPHPLHRSCRHPQHL